MVNIITEAVQNTNKTQVSESDQPPAKGYPSSAQQPKTKDFQHIPDTLPLTGKSRWSKIKKFSPVSRETFRKQSKAGQAPQPERLGIRCTYYDNQELHRWLKDPANYRIEQKS